MDPHAPAGHAHPAPHTPKRRFTKRRLMWAGIGVSAIALVAVGAFVWSRRPSGQDTYETAVVRRGTLARTVEATGAVKAASEFSLDFDTSGRVKNVFVKVGEAVKTGQILAELDVTDIDIDVRRARAGLAVAVANLNLKTAGESPEAIRVTEAEVAKADANLAEARTTLANKIRTTALAVSNAELSVRSKNTALVQAKRERDDTARLATETLIKRYDTARADLLKAVVSFATSMNDMDLLLGVDSTTANDAFESILGSQDTSSVEAAKNAYRTAKEKQAAAERAVQGFGSATQPVMDAAFAPVLAASEAVFDALAKTRAVLDATAPSAQLTLTELNTRKTTMSTDRTTVVTDYGTVLADRSTIASTKIENTNDANTNIAAVENADIVLTQATFDLEIAKLDAETQVLAQRAAVAVMSAARDGAVASLDLKKVALRAVDRAPFEASVEEARASLAIAEEGLRKARITAPADGIITDVAVSTGEDSVPRISSSGSVQSTSAVTMLGVNAEIEADIPENDIIHVRVGQELTATFDALGPDRLFTGNVISVNPAETVIQDVVYYKVRIILSENAPDVKPGMTATVVLAGTRRDNVLIIPFRAVREVAGSRVVRVLKADNTFDERVVTLGERGDQGTVEIVDGLVEGETIIVSIRPAT
ncbi:MAG: efflux RND transporter periplasmic adaptor subunit [Patescibacteria group bacterium]